MFTGIIESLGKVVGLKPSQGNLDIIIEASFTNELKIDQSVSHNGACLTVVAINGNQYTVTAIAETLAKTSLNHQKVGDLVNLERSMIMNGRLDGHIVQGHVDQTGICTSIENQDGSWLFTFRYDNTKQEHITVEKGSICINGVSLTVVNSRPDQFSVAIIPYTYEHTTFHKLKINDVVNLEFDIIGKYVARYAYFYKKDA